jgi:hypothetical protein
MDTKVWRRAAVQRRRGWPGGGGWRGAACGRMERGASMWVRERHAQEPKARHKDRWSPACLGVRVKRRTATIDVERRATLSPCARSRKETVSFSLV